MKLRLPLPIYRLASEVIFRKLGAALPTFNCFVRPHGQYGSRGPRCLGRRETHRVGHVNNRELLGMDWPG
jgi:hypothetical protein